VRIAGVDPGTIRTGIAIVESEGRHAALLFSGTVHTDSIKPIAERLQVIYTELKQVFETWAPQVVALESVFYQKDFKAAVKVGEARAAAMLSARAFGVPVVEYSPARVKESICGNGRAAKEQIQYMVRHILNYRGTLSADSADAVAIALCHVHSQRFRQIEKEHAHV
jgi:crossover junction endodeoxyribonuclease RuvC